MKKHLIAIFILALIMIVLPQHLRFAAKNPTLPGKEPYYHARMATTILEGIPETDNTIGRPYILEPYHIVLAGTYKLVGPLAFNLLPAVFALASLIFFWLLLKTFKVPQKMQDWILLAYALSPPLIASGTLGSPNSFVLALILAGAWLVRTKWWWLSIPVFILASISALAYTIAAFTLLLLLILIQKNKKALIPAIICVVIFAINYYPPKIPIQKGIIQYISDLGGIYGFSIFAALLAIVGAALVWKYKKTYYGAYAVVIIFLATSFFMPELLIFANILISALAGIALSKLAERKWQLSFLREAALLVLFCGLLFSGISQAVNISKMQPMPEFFKALEFPPGTVLTHENYGFWVEIAGHKAITDPLWKEIPDSKDIKWDVAMMFGSTEMEKTEKLLKEYNITHILITPEMKHGLVWEREEQGLNFLVENNEMFKKIKQETSIGVYKIT
ncbi:hypothetical protein KY319_01970 [Candidatus Woesearchaeota archaeon]|nr:hypothetical protein [Candidatus Woesearchaeota archaeon]